MQKSFFTGTIGLYTDYYELNMALGYFSKGKHKEAAVFDYFFRTHPFESGFTIFAGLQDFLEMLRDFRYSPDDLKYLKLQGFPDDFLEFLAGFSFRGTIYSVEEGEIVFPGEPLMRVHGNLVETQLIESLLLNVLNFESLVATKSYRIRMVAGERNFAEFGLRRAQGLGALWATRAAAIGGADSTSNVLGAAMYDISPSGTLAHSWIQSFDNELDAFRAFAEVHGSKTILLVDTYDTLQSGVPNAIIVAREMESGGERLKAIRLDSGDLAYLSKKARKMLDEAGYPYVKIVASNQLNEYVIQSLLNEQNAPIDAFGVGTELVSGKPDAALDGVYKLAAINDRPKMKISDNVQKMTLPGVKNLFRFFDADGLFYRDGIFLADETPGLRNILFHPVFPEKRTDVSGLHYEELLKPVFTEGKALTSLKTPSEINQYLKNRIALLPVEHRRFIQPHLYKAGISEKLMKLKSSLIEEALERKNKE